MTRSKRTKRTLLFGGVKRRETSGHIVIYFFGVFIIHGLKGRSKRNERDTRSSWGGLEFKTVRSSETTEWSMSSVYSECSTRVSVYGNRREKEARTQTGSMRRMERER